jgi:hypothetical protein
MCSVGARLGDKLPGSLKFAIPELTFIVRPFIPTNCQCIHKQDGVKAQKSQRHTVNDIYPSGFSLEVNEILFISLKENQKPPP